MPLAVPPLTFKVNVASDTSDDGTGGAVSADVTSANTVGYMTAQVAKANYKTFSVNLTDCGNPTAPVRIDKLFTIDKITTAPGWGDAMDQIWRWDTATGEWIQYYNRKPSGRDTSGDTGWCKKGATTVTTDTIPAGVGFFFYRATGAATDTIKFTYGDGE